MMGQSLFEIISTEHRRLILQASDLESADEKSIALKTFRTLKNNFDSYADAAMNAIYRRCEEHACPAMESLVTAAERLRSEVRQTLWSMASTGPRSTHWRERAHDLKSRLTLFSGKDERDLFTQLRKRFDTDELNTMADEFLTYKGGLKHKAA